MATIPEALAIAIQHHQAGRLGTAEQIYRQVLAIEPDRADAVQYLGVIAHQLGHLNDAVACYLRALELKPDYVEAFSNLGAALTDLGKLEEAATCCRRALELKPDYVEAHSNLGNALTGQGKLDQAVAHYRQALALKPDYAEAHYNLGSALAHLGKLDEAAACCRRALELKPDYAEAHNNLGNIFKDQGMLDEAIACYRQTLALNPEDAVAHCNLGVAFKEQGRLDEAVACCRRALELNPDFAEAHRNLGSVLKDQGKLHESLACCRRAMRLAPERAEIHSNLLYTQLYCPDIDPRTLYEEHRRWNRQHAAPLAKSIQPHVNDRSPDRRVRVGYVSPEFRRHCQALFTVPLFSSHNHEDFEIVCYADVANPDEITQRLRSHADAWRDITGFSDEQVAQLIRRDGIDILVDLTMHMARSRLLVFARKPAPVQVCWLAYPGTTGVSTIDYRITDPRLDPPGLYDDCYSETSIRLPDSFWCYDPLDREPAVNALPAAKKGYISFGCLNNFCKVNPLVLKLWARVLRAVDRSRLTLLAAKGSHRQHTLDLLAEEGVARDRVTFAVHLPRQEYLRQYHGIDIGLDTVPYNGHTTSLDSFWMGVPVVTLVGPTVVGRAGLSQLTNLSLPELIAFSPEEYVRIAVALAEDLPRLGNLRATLRERMQSSPLMDAPRFARNLEAAFREMWRRWCAQQALMESQED